MLQLEGLKKQYGDVVALDGCGFTVPRGRIVGFVGPNGAGKTTAMRSIFGLMRPDVGTVRWDGGAIGLEQRRRFGYMPEERGLYPKTPVRHQLTYFARLHGMSRGDAEGAADHWLKRLDLDDRADSKLEELSHGNQQRVQLAAALVHSPELLVLDEPFTGLDPIAVREVDAVIAEEAARGAAVVFCSHQLDLVEGLVEEVVIIDHGRVVLSGSLDDLRDRSAVHYLEISVADADVDWLPSVPGVQVLERAGGDVRLEVPADTDPGPLLAAARSAGRLRHFRFEPPRLSDLFMQAVAP